MSMVYCILSILKTFLMDIVMQIGLEAVNAKAPQEVVSFLETIWWCGV